MNLKRDKMFLKNLVNYTTKGVECGELHTEEVGQSLEILRWKPLDNM